MFAGSHGHSWASSCYVLKITFHVSLLPPPTPDTYNGPESLSLGLSSQEPWMASLVC